MSIIRNLHTHSPRFAVAANDVIPELKKHMLVDGFDNVVDLQRSHGSWFVEGRTGKQYLDFFTCIASMPIGMNHPKMLDQGFIEYLGHLALNKPSNSDIYNVEQATFVKTFFELAVPSHFKYAFFIDGGTLAVENALKVAFDWKARRNRAKGLPEGRGSAILHFEKAFHGRSGYTLSLTNTDPSKTDLFPKFNWPRVKSPYLRFPVTADELERVQAEESESIAQIRDAFNKADGDIAAIILEPIQGEGGDNHFRKEFLQQLRVLADEYDALLIFDEVQTGVGMTGAMWAHEAIGVIPDIISFGKKMQVCGILVGERVDNVPDNVFHTSSRINSTWGGSLVDMVRATRYLEIIDEEHLVQNASTVGSYMQAKLHELASDYSKLVTNVRGMGLFCAFDLPDTASRKALLDDTYNNGLIMVGCGPRSIRFRPALNITTELVDAGIDIIRRSL